MKINAIISGIIAFVLIGCNRSKETSVTNFTPLENGFGYGQHSYESYPMHTATWTGLQYQDSAGKMTDVWAYLSMANPAVQITNNLAVLVGGKAELYDDGRERLRDRLMAFEAPAGPPMDITDQVLRKYCVDSGIDFTNVIKDSFGGLVKTNDALLITFGIIKIGERGPGTINAHDASMIISWSEIKTIMQDVKKTGKLKKEKQSGVEYLQKE